MARRLALPSAFPVTALLAVAPGPAEAQDRSPDGQAVVRTWAIEGGFRIEPDAAGFTLPVALAFVPEPGDAPDDPLYFVLELRGAVKVVTNDRTVHTFADLADLGYAFEPPDELPEQFGQGGAAGICLDPAGGHVFVTTIYVDDRELIRYNMIRFDGRPGTFGLEAEGHHDFVDLFRDVQGAVTHQIGPCIVRGRELFVAVGDTWRPFETRDPDSPYGKLLRMDFEGNPLPDNPYFGQGNGEGFRDYVWAYGLRNLFSVTLLDGRIWGADNGIEADRFMEIERGRNYLFDGTDVSISTNALFVWYPSLGPVQMDYVPEGALGFPEPFTDAFFVALSADVTRDKEPGIYILPFDRESGTLREVPGYFLRYEGARWEMVTGLATGPDGLYFTALAPHTMGETPVFRITYDPPNQHARTLVAAAGPFFILRNRGGCLGCHTLWDNGYVTGGQLGEGIGPPLDRSGAMTERVTARVNSPEFEEELRYLMASEDHSNPHYDELRREVLAAEGPERARVWMHHFIQNPTFDRRYVPQMPDAQLTDAETALIVEYLLRVPEPPGVRDRIRHAIPRPIRTIHLAMAFGIGAVATAVLLLMAWAVVQRRRGAA